MKMKKNWLIWIAVMFGVFMLFRACAGPGSMGQKISYSDFMYAVENGKIEEVKINGSIAQIRFKGVDSFKQGIYFETHIPFKPDQEFIKSLREKNVKVSSVPPTDGGIGPVLLGFLPMLLFIGIWIWMMKGMNKKLGGGLGGIFSFGKTKAKFYIPRHDKRVSFNDVAGMPEVKDEIIEIVHFLKNPKEFTRLGAVPPKGVILIGAPGCGKTLLARATADEAGVPFLSVSGSEFVEMYVGVGAARIRDLFAKAKSKAPCIIFIDELDAVGRHRGAGIGGGHDEKEQTLNQLFIEIDGFEGNTGVILMGATNRPDVLDPALLRPGRFDRKIIVPFPSLQGREDILRVHARGRSVAEDVDFKVVARRTPLGFTGAHLENLFNEATIIATRKNKSAVGKEDFQEAADKVIMGVARKSQILGGKEKEISAYHESGHTLVGLFTPETDPVEKISIVPRGLALGMTKMLPKEDRYLQTKPQLKGKIIQLLGGRIAEGIKFGLDNISSGASNDLEEVTELARKMVCRFGMSNKLGNRTFGKTSDQVFLGRQMGLSHQQDYSEATAQKIDEEIERIVTEAGEKAREILQVQKKKGALDRLAKELMEKEELDIKEINKIVKK